MVITILSSISTEAAVTIKTGISLSGISNADAYLGNLNSTLNVTQSPGTFCLGYVVSGGGAAFTLNSLKIEISLNGILQKTENYTEYETGGAWNMFGTYSATNSYVLGLFNQGPILTSSGSNVDAFGSNYYALMAAGDTLTATLTFNINGIPTTSTTSFARIVYVPEPNTALLSLLTIIPALVIRRKV